MYTKEFNVKWEQLSTDLQNVINNIQSNTKATSQSIENNGILLTTVEHNINKFLHDLPTLEAQLDKYIEDLETRISLKIVNSAAITASTENATDILTNGNSLYGQVAKIKVNNINKVTASDYVKECRVVSNATEKSAEFADPPKLLKDVYDGWVKFAHYDQEVIPSIDSNDYDLKSRSQAPRGYQPGKYRRGVQRLNQDLINSGTAALNAWKYTASTDTLECTLDSVFTSGFINPEEIGPNDYIFEVKIDTMGDNDHVGIVVGYTKDVWQRVPGYYNSIPDPIEHTLSIVRSKNNKQTYMLVYDLGWSSQYIIKDLSTSTGIGTSSNNTVYLMAIKRYDEVEFKTSYFGSSSTAASYPTGLSFKFSIPFQKPIGWSAQMYQNIKEMLRYSSRVGLITRSNKAKFNILQQKYITEVEDYVYSLYENKVYEYKHNSSSWSSIGTLDNYLEPRIFLANPRNDHLFFYYQNGIYRQMG